MRDKKILILGDSHVHALQKSIKSYKPVEGVKIIAYRFLKPKNGGVIGDISAKDADRAVKKLSSDSILVTSIGGNQHSVFGLIQHPLAFDFLSPDVADKLMPETTLIPYNVLKDVFEKGVKNNDGAKLAHLRSIARVPVFCLASPPPKQNESHIMKYHETHFQNSGLAEYGITPAIVRLKLWHLQMRVTQQICADTGVRFLYPPTSACCDDGFLKPEFYANDATHANNKYGDLIIQYLIQVLTNLKS